MKTQNYLEMMMRTNIRRILVTALGVAALSASAIAGQRSASEVAISDTYGWAYGDAGHVYATSDRTQDILCEVDGDSGNCYAHDVNGVFRSCWSSDPNWVSTMAAVKGDSYIVFYWNTDGTCAYVGVQNDSLTDRK